jgi:hypothetical protein
MGFNPGLEPRLVPLVAIGTTNPGLKYEPETS